MTDSSEYKDWDVEIQYGGRRDTLAIRAATKTAAELIAASLLKRRRKRPDTRVIQAKEKQSKRP